MKIQRILSVLLVAVLALGMFAFAEDANLLPPPENISVEADVLTEPELPAEPEASEPEDKPTEAPETEPTEEPVVEPTEEPVVEPTEEPETGCPGCGAEAACEACAVCGAYVCEEDFRRIKHNAVCTGCGEAYCGAFHSKGHSVCPCGALSCAEDFDPAAHVKCDCGYYVCEKQIFKTNHSACECCGMKVCADDYATIPHSKCGSCGMHKCDEAYKPEAHKKCNGCHEVLCISEADHSFCEGCKRYVCRELDNYGKYDHRINWKGRWLCLDIEEEPTPPPAPPKPEVRFIPDGDTGRIVSINGGDTVYRGTFSDKLVPLTHISVGEGITRLNNRALCKMPTLTSVDLPDSLTYIDESAFQETAITSIEIPENVTFIGFKAFNSCDKLETITILSKKVTLDNYMARYCKNLKDIYLHSEDVTCLGTSQLFSNYQHGNFSQITIHVKSKEIADKILIANGSSHGYTIKNIDTGTIIYDSTQT